MTRIAAALAAALLLAGLGASGRAAAQGASSSWKLPAPLPRPAHGVPVVVLVVLSGVSLSDLDAAPTTAIHSLMESGAVGVMNARTAPATPGRTRRAIDSLVLHPEEIRPTTLESGSLTLGAGTRSFARSEAGDAFDADELVAGCPAAAWWAQRTGRRAGHDAIYQISVPRLAAAQASLRYPAAPGALGDALRHAGMPVAVVGNADDDTGPHREAACIAMDGLGRVPLGSVGAALSPRDPLSPGGRRADSDAVVSAAEAALRAGARLVVVETGDTARVERASEEIHSTLRARRRQEAIARADCIVAGLLKRVDATRALLMLVAPAPSLDAARAGDPLAPVVLAGWGIERGILFSPSTRTPGLATNTDVAPTILAFLGLPAPPQMVGRPLSSQHDTRAAATVLAMEERYRRTEDYTRPVMRWLVWVQVALLGAFFLLAWARPHPNPVSSRVVQAGALAFIALPAALMLAGIATPPSATVGLAAIVTLDVSLVAAAHGLRRWASPAGLLFAAVAGILAFDTVAGSSILQASPLGYSPYSGARYYGIGNEGFGCLVAALVFALAFLWPRRSTTPPPNHPTTSPLLAVAAFGLASAALIGHPRLGANFGGALSAAATGAAAAAVALRGRLSRRRVVALVLVGLAVAALPVAFEMVAGGSRQSHIGRAIEEIRAGGPGIALGIITRKLAMNFLLLKRSPWSRLLLLAGLALAYVLRPRLRQMQEHAPVVWGAVQATLVGAAAAFLFNDSGVLPAAEMVIAAMAAVVISAGELPKEDAGDQAAAP